MSFFDRFRRRRWSLGELQPPWGPRPSIYDHLRAQVAPGGKGLTDLGKRLPDEERFEHGAGVRWASGAPDGVMGHHGGDGEDEGLRARQIASAVRALLERPADTDLAQLYRLALRGPLLPLVDRVMEELLQAPDEELHPERLHALGVYLATRSPDREPVKLGIALCGLVEGSDDLEVLRTLGRHEELTLYVGVALSRQLAAPERVLWELAQEVRGWGRIHLVERLAETRDPEIRAWMLREGFRNEVMDEYLAWTCATAGGLLEALEADEVGDALLDGAAGILRALADGGPARDLGDYADGAAACERFLVHLCRRGATSLPRLLAAGRLGAFVGEEEADWQARAAHGWTEERRARVRDLLADLRAESGWRELVLAGLASDDDASFYQAAEAARLLGIDSWERHLERVRGDPVGSSSWYWLVADDDEDRLRRAVALAEEVLPLAAIATGPATELGLGPAFRPHQALDFVLQGLGRVPRLGWRIVAAGLRSPVVRNRNGALRVLDAWRRDRWPPEAQAALEAALAAEPDEDVREAMGKVLRAERREG